MIRGFNYKAPVSVQRPSASDLKERSYSGSERRSPVKTTHAKSLTISSNAPHTVTSHPAVWQKLVQTSHPHTHPHTLNLTTCDWYRKSSMGQCHSRVWWLIVNMYTSIGQSSDSCGIHQIMQVEVMWSQSLWLGYGCWFKEFKNGWFLEDNKNSIIWPFSNF